MGPMRVPSGQRYARYTLQILLLIYGVLSGPVLGWHVSGLTSDEEVGAPSATAAKLRQQATFPRQANTGECELRGGIQLRSRFG